MILYPETGPPNKEIKMGVGDDGASLTLDNSPSRDNQTEMVSVKIPIRSCSIRRATEPDPDYPQFAGSKILRDNLRPQDAMKAFVITCKTISNGGESSRSNFNLAASTEYECADLVQGLILMVANKQISIAKVQDS